MRHKGSDSTVRQRSGSSSGAEEEGHLYGTISAREGLKLIGDYLPYLRKYWRECTAAGTLMSLTVLLQLPMPLLTRHIIDHVLPSQDFVRLNWIIGVLLLVLIANLLVGFYSRFLLAKVRELVLKKIQLKVFDHAQRLSIGFHRSHHLGYFMSRIGNDVYNLGGLLADNFITFALDSLTFAVGISVLFVLHWRLAVVSIIALPLFIYSIHFFSHRIRRASGEVQESIGRVTSVIAEDLAAISLVKSSCMESVQARKLLNRVHRSIRAKIRLTVQGSLSSYVTAAIGGLGPLLLLWYGSREVMSDHLTLGTLIAFSAFLGYVYGPAQRLMGMNTQLQTSLASAQRIGSFLAVRTEEYGSGGKKQDSRLRGEVHFEHVSFNYDATRTVLDDVSLNVEAGTRIALVGRSGAGKTSLVNLLLRFYDCSAGRILIDGTDIRAIGLASLRASLGIVPQDVHLLSGTIRENISCGMPGVSDGDIEAAARVANIHDFILQLPSKYESDTGERGVRLSGGERQRIAIARTVLRDPRILILDEATSEIDSESESLIQQALHRLMKGRTCIIIAHRLSTLHVADRIAVLEGGRIVAQGTHSEIYEECQLYKRLYDLQFSRQSGVTVSSDDSQETPI